MLLAELDDADGEHADVSIADESRRLLSAFPGGAPLLEDVEGEGTLERPDATSGEVLKLFEAVARGDLDAVHEAGWTRSA